MVILPKVRGFICTTAHPAGCEANVRAQIEYVKAQPKTDGGKKVLVVGASMGYGLASRIAAAYSCGAATVGVIFDKPGTDSKPGSAGWYNTAAFEKAAAEDGLYAKTVNGDAYSKEIKDKVISLIKKDLGKIDMLIYSMAAPRRTMADGTVYSSVLKTTGDSYTNKTIDLRTKEITEVTIPPASDEEILATVKVMGGEDWMDWIEALKAADAIEKNAVTLAYSYIGPALTHPVYMDGSIGRAKAHLFETSKAISEKFPDIRALISVNKALVTQSSAAIPIVPLYISILYKVMKEQGVHEGCIEQMYRLLHDKVFGDPAATDEEGRIRMDDLEMKPEIQKRVSEIWERINSEALNTDADIDGYWEDFYRLFGFRVPGVDYEADVSCTVPVPSIEE
jgi:enoyl-[acyl-carrier protein] reductase/trans-2-enoyl-CoA reductase (NAD+)